MAEIKKIVSTDSKNFEEERELLHRQLLSSVSHDLKTPLSAMIGSLEIYEMMKEKLSEEKKDGLIKTALQEAYRLDNFVTNILDMAKLENGMIKTRIENTDLQLMLRDCIDKVGHRFKKFDIKLMPLKQPVTIDTDPALYSRVIGVLIDNAIKFGGNPSLVELETDFQGNEVSVTVKDNGLGIPKEKMEDIFSKYSRIKLQDHQNAGTGLGLSIGRGIAKLLGGSLIAENNSTGTGSKFTFSVPVKRVN